MKVQFYQPLTRIYLHHMDFLLEAILNSFQLRYCQKLNSFEDTQTFHTTIPSAAHHIPATLTFE